MDALICQDRNRIAFDEVAIDQQHDHAFADTVGILYSNLIFRAAETAGDGISLPVLGNAGIDHEAIVVGLDAEDVVRDRCPVPGRRTGEPGVFGLSMVCGGMFSIRISAVFTSSLKMPAPVEVAGSSVMLRLLVLR